MGVFAVRTCTVKWRFCGITAVVAALSLLVACGPRKPVGIPSEWHSPPPVQAAPATKQAESAKPPKPAPIIKPQPVIKESDLTAPQEVPVSQPGGKESPPSSPQRVASLHLVEQARALLAQGKADAAIPLLEQAIQVDVHNGDAFLALAQAWRAKGARQKALQFAQKAEILSQDDPSKLKQVYLLQADLYKELGDNARTDVYRKKALTVK